jgi:formate/nitrite transporter FocA (FNT family)
MISSTEQELKFLALRPQWLVCFLLNQCGSLVYYFLLGTAGHRHNLLALEGFGSSPIEPSELKLFTAMLVRACTSWYGIVCNPVYLTLCTWADYPVRVCA